MDKELKSIYQQMHLVLCAYMTDSAADAAVESLWPLVTEAAKPRLVEVG